MLKCYLNKPLKKCHDFQALNLKWEFVFDQSSKLSSPARDRLRTRGIGRLPKIRRLIRVLDDVNLALLQQCPDVEWCEVEGKDEPLYAPTDPNGLNYAWTKQTLTHATNTTAFDLEKGDDLVIGIIEESGAGANYTDAELGGTGDRATDWAAIQAGTHAKFANYTTGAGVSVDPYGTGHGNSTSRQAVAVMDNATAYCGSCPNAKVMMAVGQNFDTAIQRLADLGVDVISVSYTNCYGHRTAIQYAITAGVIVVYAHGSNSHVELAVVPFEALLVGGFSDSDVSERSYGVGLTLISRGPTGSAESWSTPAVAGIVGLLLAANPLWNIYDVWAALIQTCQKPAEMGGATWHLQYGFGIPDAYAALQLAQEDLEPLPPIDLALGASPMVKVSWVNLAITTFDHFEVRRKQDAAPTDETDGELVYSGTNLSFDDPDFTIGTWYYAVWAVDTEGRYSAYPDYVADSITLSLDQPEITSVVATGDDRLVVSWDAVGCEKYKVYWDTDTGEPYANSVEVLAGETYTIESLNDGQVYFITVSALDGADNESEKADEVNAIAGGPDLTAFHAILQQGILHVFYTFSHAPAYNQATIVKNQRILKLDHTLTEYYSQAKTGDIFEIYAHDNSGNRGQRWTVIVSMNRLTVARKGD